MFVKILLAIQSVLFLKYFVLVQSAMTMKQIDQSMALFRKTCVDKSGVDPALVDGIHKGIFPDTEMELKCFTFCVAQAAGLLDRKKQVSEQKARRQIEIIVPVNLRKFANDALDKCKDIQKLYKDLCDKTYYAAKCLYDFSPSEFVYP